MADTISLTLNELQSLLDEQKRKVGEYITRNLSVYSFYNDNAQSTDYKKIDLEKTKDEMRTQCWNSGYPTDFNVLKKYLK